MNYEKMTKAELIRELNRLESRLEIISARGRAEKVEEKLKVSEEKYKSLIENLQDNFIFYSHNTEGVFTYVSTSIMNVLGYLPEEFLSHYSKYMTDNPENEKVVKQTALSLKGIKQPPYEVEIYHKNGSVRTLKVQEVPVFDEQGRVSAVDGIAEDVTNRKKAAKVLWESKEKYYSLVNDILNSSMVGIFILDKKFNVVCANQAIERFFGMRKECFIGKDKKQLICNHIKNIFENPKSFMETVIATYDNNTYTESFECHVLSDGKREERYLEHWSMPIDTGVYKGGRIEQYTDITKSRKTKDALCESQKMLGIVMDNIPQSIYWKDTKSVYMGCNKNFAKKAGKESVEEVIGKTDYDLAWKKEESDFFHKCDRRVMDTKKPEYHIVKRRQQADGKQAWFDTNKIPLCDFMGNVIGILGTSEDITERQEAEGIIEKFKILINNISDLAYICDANGNVLYLNNAFEELSGHKPEEFIGKPFTPLFDKENLKKAMELYTKTLEGKTLRREVTFKNTGIVCEYNNIPLRDKQGNIIGVLGIARNITERKKMEEELTKLNTTLQEQDKVRTAFMSTVSHEVRTPLTLVLGFVRIIDKKLERIIFPLINIDNSKVNKAVKQIRKNFKIIKSEGDRLTFLINDILDISKIEAGKIDWQMKNLSVAEIIKGSLEASNSFYEMYELEIVAEIESGLPEVMANNDKLKQVLINLISNALKFTEQGPVLCSARKVNREIVISVIDKGIGVAEADQERIFEKFYQIRNEHKDTLKGTGLGLAICKEIVEYHGGRIWVESKLGKGSNFSFSIPYISE
ncbi:signal transduction histidine kinase [Candidatus Scalindua japonica]|uniref:histidine kinase n=1 Tax=Candidatus Scalindua japonica TaxID=1284222 RepID=A0A286TVR2_9BACT|nr:PAS domain S-box protein [Candidatus Scalindua japonica]GAX59986.1 signal transduction histidine kinase [Candidatus Scalindua japonica]